MVTVIIPTYNRAAKLTQAVESALAQTFRDFEIIVIDDGSTDNTADAMRRFSEHIRYLRQENRGVSAARNRGMAAANGQWIAFLDSDDVWFPEKLETQMRLLRQQAPEIQVCFSDCVVPANLIVCQTQFERAGFAPESQSQSKLESPMRHILASDYIIHTSTLIVAKRLAIAIGGFDEEMMVAEDTDFLFRLALSSEFCFVATPMVRTADIATPDTDRLSAFYVQKRDEAFTAQLHMYEKWLRLTGNSAEVAAAVRAARRAIFESWVISKLKRGEIIGAIEVLRKASRNEQSSLVTLASLGLRFSHSVGRRARGLMRRGGNTMQPTSMRRK